MTPEPSRRAAELVIRWVRCYTRQLPSPLARRRIDEISADLHDHITHEQAMGKSDRRIALSVLSRMVHGLAADVSWRGRIRPWRGDLMKSFAAVLALALTIAAAGVLAVMYGSDGDTPELVLIGILLIVGSLALSVRTAHRRGQSVDSGHGANRW